MITINDLNLLIAFWKWLCELTEDYFIFNHHEYVWIQHKKTRERWRMAKADGLNDQNLITLKNTIESIIYQAIEGINNKGDYEIMQSKKGINVFEKDYYKSEKIIFFAYKNTITAWLAAFKWIWEQVNKKESL